MEGVLPLRFFQCAMVTVFVAIAVEPCFGEECVIDGESSLTGHFEGDVVSLLQDSKAHRRLSQLPTADSILPAPSSTVTTVTVDQSSSNSHRLSHSVAGQHAENHLQGNGQLVVGQAPRNSLEVSLLSLANSQQTTSTGVVLLVMVVVIVVVVLFAVFCCASSSEPSDTKVSTSKLGNIKGAVKNVHRPDMKWFFWQYINRLMLLLVAAVTLMTWLSFCKAIMPQDASTWNIWCLLLFTAGFCLVMVAYAWWYGSLTERLASYAKTIGGEKAEKETHLVMEKSYGSVTNVTGYVLVQVWLQVYPIPTDANPWWSVVVFIGIVAVAVVCALVENAFTDAGNDTGQKIMSQVSSNILGAGTWIIVGFWVLDIRKFAGAVPMTKPPPVWLGFACLFASVFIMIATQMLIAYGTGVSSVDEEAHTKTDFFGVKAMTLMNSACLFTTGLLIFEILSEADAYKTQYWWWSIMFWLGAGALLVMLQFLFVLIVCFGESGAKVKAQMLSMMTNLAGWLSGKMLAMSFVMSLTGISTLWFIPIAIVCQVLAIFGEEVRMNYLTDIAAAIADVADDDRLRRDTSDLKREEASQKGGNVKGNVAAPAATG